MGDNCWPRVSWTCGERAWGHLSFYGTRQHTPSIQFRLTRSILAVLYQKQIPLICYSCLWLVLVVTVCEQSLCYLWGISPTHTFCWKERNQMITYWVVRKCCYNTVFFINPYSSCVIRSGFISKSCNWSTATILCGNGGNINIHMIYLS